jgi:hypothetical protein
MGRRRKDKVCSSAQAQALAACARNTRVVGFGWRGRSGVGGFFWWRHYQSTPAYAVTLLVDAAQRNDVAAFEKLINDDEVAKIWPRALARKQRTVWLRAE